MDTDEIYKEFNDSFSSPIWSVVNELKNANPNTNKLLITALNGSLNRLIYKWTDKPSSMVSKSVLQIFKNENPPVNPFDILAHQVGRYGYVILNGVRKKRFVWEHTTPISEFIETLLECNNEREVKANLADYSGVCLITRTEDNCLNSKGFKNKRPGGWKVCYKKCKIVPVKRDDFMTKWGSWENYCH